MNGLKMRTAKAIRRFALILALITTSAYINAQNIIYEKEDSIFIENINRKHPAGFYDTTGERIIAIAKEFVGNDYVPGTLDRYDNEPLYLSCSELDCTTFVELIVAMATCNSNDFTGTCNTLEQIRYRNGIRNGYTSRLHYISWWITDSAKHNKICEIETPWHTATQQLDLNFMSTHTESYRHLKENNQYIQEITTLEKPYRGINVKYIPKSNIKGTSEKDIKNGDIIAIVTAIEGLDVTHMGFAYWNNNELHMIHASSAAGKVINDAASLNKHLAKNKNNLGIRVFRAL